MTDNYEYARSMMSQSDDKYTPYAKKEFNYVNDINSGVYTNSSLSLVQFDLTSIYNSSRFTDTNDLFVVVPIVLQAIMTATNTAVAPSTIMPASLLSLTTNNCNLIHQADVVCNGKVVEQVQPYINKFLEFKMASQFSINDLKTVAPSLGFSDNLDCPNSIAWNNITTATASYSGNGVCNNRPFSPNASVGSPYPTRMVASLQNQGCVNTALSQRVGFYADATQTAKTAGGQNLFGTLTDGSFLMTGTQLSNEFKPYYTVLATNYMVWYDALVIRVKDLFDSMANFGLSKRLDATMRLYINTGTINVNVTSPNTTTLGYYSALSQSTFTNTCPLVVNYLPDTVINGGIPATVTNIVAGCYLARPPTTSIQGQNMASSGASHPMSSCRCYYSSIDLKPQYALKYIEENRAKKVIYKSVISNIFNAIPAGGSWNQLVQSGITRPAGLIIMPFVDSTVTSSGGFSAGGSPFDTNICHPLSLTNVQCAVGGVNQLANTLYFTYEDFLEQVNIFENISPDTGISCGLISRQFWEMNRVVYIDISRGNPADALTPRNIQVSFSNNNSVAISVLIFVVYLDELEVDVETGNIKK